MPFIRDENGISEFTLSSRLPSVQAPMLSLENGSCASPIVGLVVGIFFNLTF